jgi:hypothetical protein
VLRSLGAGARGVRTWRKAGPRTTRRVRALARRVVRGDGGPIVHYRGEYERSGAVLGEQAFEQPDDGLAIPAREIRHDTHHQSLRTTRGDALGRRFESALQSFGGVEGDGVGHFGSSR